MLGHGILPENISVKNKWKILSDIFRGASFASGHIFMWGSALRVADNGDRYQLMGSAKPRDEGMILGGGVQRLCVTP